jgi:2-polyprenyl-3-methyl-5-hydroxy-6-metoxy-1,4-benzoquinol methylase
MDRAHRSLRPADVSRFDADDVVLDHADGVVRIRKRLDRKHHITVTPRPGLWIARTSWVTSYPLALIEEIYAAKGLYVCDEIMREEDPRLVEHCVRCEVLSYVDASAFADKRVLDFGCGSGASTMVLAKLLPECEIVGIELEPKLLRVANLRAAHFGRTGVRFMLSPSGDSLPDDLGLFDFVIFSAVFEHLLPGERPLLLPKIWDHLKPGGILFLNQTPYRYSPVEMHTTRLPLINYLPDALALRAARRFSKRVKRDEAWETLLRRGIRGATVREVLGILETRGRPVLLEPARHIGDHIDLWYWKLSRRLRWFKRSIWASLKTIKALTGVELVPSLTLAILKER